VTIHTFRRGHATRACEARVSSDGEAYELVVTRDGASHVESFSSLDAMLTRERELLNGWRAHGWQEVA
jgi:hypothetical protein